MKANEAPKKIYVASATFPDYVDFDGSPINTKRIDDHDIEYTRTDAFIEKVEKFLRMNTDIDMPICVKDGEPLAESYLEHEELRIKAQNQIIDKFKEFIKAL